MRKFLLIALGTTLGSVTLFALYVVWHPNPNDISPEVDAVSYRSLFNTAVQGKTGKTFEQMDDAGRLKVLSDLIGSAKESDPVREVALYEIRTIQNKDAAFEVIHKNLATLGPDLYEVGVASVNSLGTPKARTYLEKLYSSLAADPFAHTPMGNYRTSTVVVSPEAATGDVRVAFQERSRLDADYTVSKAREIALFLPAGATHVFAFPNFDDVLTRFNDSRFVTSLKGTPVGQDAWTLPLLSSIASLRERLTEDVGFMASYFSPERLFRDHLLIGNYGGQFLIVSFKDKNATVAETLMGIFEKLGSDFGVRRSNLNGVTIATVASKKTKKSLSYATVGNYFVVCTDTLLMARSIRTYTLDRGSSLAIDPVFNRAYNAVDMTGEKDAAFAWINPSEYFAVSGSEMPAARRLAILARSLGKPVEETAPVTANLATVPGVIGTWRIGGSDMAQFWKYLTGVRTVGKRSLDSLKRVTGVDLGSQVMPFIGPTATIGYAGVEYMRNGNGYSTTGFNILLAAPLKSATADFDKTLLTLFRHSSRVRYSRDSSYTAGRVWIGVDTTMTDSMAQQHALQPSFAVTNDGMLLVASTPGLLRTALNSRGGLAGTAEGFMGGMVRVDSLAGNSEKYLRPYLRSTDKYTPEEINVRMEPLRKAVSLYDRFEWTVKVGGDGLRAGEGRLTARK